MNVFDFYFRNEHINFTLFFIENSASKKDIISVIETSAPKVQQNDATVALVDKFEIELENAKIKIEHERTPINFNKIIPTTTTVATTKKPTTKMKIITTMKITTTKKTTIKPTTMSSSTKMKISTTNQATQPTTEKSTTRSTRETTTIKVTTMLPTTVTTTSTSTTPVTTVTSPESPTTNGWESEWTEDDICK